MGMPIQQSNQEEWRDSPARSNKVRIIDFIFSNQGIKIIAWFLIGSIFASMAVIYMMTEFGVPPDLLLLLFLGQGICALAIYYLQQVRWSAKHWIMTNLTE